MSLPGPPSAGATEPAPLEALARRWLACFNTRDLDGLLALYAPDAVHVSPKLRDRQLAAGDRPPSECDGSIRGVPALHDWWRGAMDRLPGLRYEPMHITCDSAATLESGGRVFMEYLRTVPGEADLVVAEVLIVSDGRIVASWVFHG